MLHFVSRHGGAPFTIRPGTDPGDAAVGYGYQSRILPAKDRGFMLRGLRMQFIFVEPGSKLVMVHTAAGDIFAMAGELLAIWSGVVKDLAE